MKPIEDGNLDIEVKMNETGDRMKNHEQILFDGFCFKCDDKDLGKDSQPL